MILREAFRSIRSSPLYWVSSVMTLGVALGLGGLFTLLSIRAHEALREVRANLTIEAFFDPALSTDEARQLAEEKLKTIPEVASIHFVSKEEALQQFAASSGENVQDVLGMNPLPASASIHLKDPGYVTATRLEAQVKGLQGVSDVRSDLGVLQTMEFRARALSGMTWVVGLLLLLSTVLYIVLTARSLVTARKETIRAYSLLGATTRTISWIFIMENLLAGLAGGLVGAFILMLLQHFVIPAVGGGVSLFVGPTDRLVVIGCAVIAGMGLEGLLTMLFAARYSRSLAV